MIKKKGFTLVELLAVITLLGLIALIIVPAVDRTIRDSKIKMEEKQKQSILTAMQEWTTDNKDLFYDNNVISMTLNDLKVQNYLDYDLRNPATGKCINGNLNLTVTKVGKKYEYSIFGDRLVDGKEKDCEGTSGYPSIYLVGSSFRNVEINTPYVELGYSAVSATGANLTSSVTFSGIETTDALKTFVIKYSVTSNGLTRKVKRTVNVVDTTAPVLTIPSDITIDNTVNTFDTRSGVTVTDNSGETIDVKIISDLSLGNPGTYTINYVATDSSGNTTNKKRTVTITRSGGQSICQATTGDGTQIGDVITCGTESFYVYDTTGDTIKMLSKYNLKVGGVYNDPTYTAYTEAEMTYKQDSTMIGYTNSQSAWLGITKYSTTSSAYTGSIVESYINNYKQILIGMGMIVEEATMITKEELETLGCTINNNSCASAPSWVYSVSYWTKTSKNDMLYRTTAVGRFDVSGFYDNRYYGVRPVIVIPKSLIQ